jgi:hypothetical protein
MATIDSKKLLPSSKAFSSKLKNKKILIPSSNIRVKKNIKAPSEDLKGGPSSGISSDSLLGIKNIISKIQGVILKSSIFQKKEQDNKRKDKEKETRRKRESKLEKKPTNKNVESGIASLPNLSFIDRIKKFLFWTILGRFFSDLFPKLIDFSKIILPAVNFIANFAGNILKGVVDFIEWGYIAYDKVRDLTKQIGGESAQKVFDDFSKHFNTFLNLALIAAMAGSGIGGSDPGKKPGRAGKPGGTSGSGAGAPYKYDRQRALIRKKYGDSAAKLYDLEIAKGKNAKQAISNIESRYIKKGRITPKRMDGSLGGTNAGSKLLSRGFKKAPARLATKMLGKAGVKIAGKVLGRIPIIGGLVDFLFALWSGEKPGRAAAKAVGATIGSALGTFIPIPLAGTILGGILGDIVGGALYDTLIAGNNKKTQSKAKGGNIGKVKVKPGGNKKRTIKITPKKPKKIEPQKTSIGKDIGGKRKIEEIYGKIELGKKSPLRALVKTSNDLKQMRSLNGLPAAMFSAGVDMTLGQKPNKDLPNQIGNTFGSIVESSINAELSSLFGQISKTLTLAEGGSITAQRKLDEGGVNNIGKKIGGKISSILSIALNSSATKIFNNLNQEFNLREGGDSGGGGGPGADGSTGPIEYGPLPLNMTQKQAFATIYELAKKHKASMPELVAGMAMHESGFLSSRLVSEANNPFGQSGKGNRGSIEYKGRSWAAYNSLSDAVKAHVDNWNNTSKAGRGAGTYESAVAGLRAILPIYAPTSDGNSHTNYIRSVSSTLSSMGFDPQKKNPLADLSNQSLIQKRKPTSSGVVPGTSGGSKLPLTGDNGRMKPEQLMKVGTLSSSPTGGPYWYGSGAYLRKSDAGPAFLRAKEAARKDGVSFVINSAYRNLDHQRALQGKYAVVAAVGGSPHGEGIALDIETNTRGWTWLKNNGPTYGWRWMAIPNDEVHFEYVGGGIAPAPSKRQPDLASNKPTPTPPVLNKGVTFKGGQFVKLGGGLLGSNQQVKVNDSTNVDLRANVKEFGLGRGKKEGERKRAADGNYYEWRNGKWVYWDPVGGGNASLPVSNLSQSVAQIGDYAPGDILMQREIIIIDRSIA